MTHPTHPFQGFDPKTPTTGWEHEPADALNVVSVAYCPSMDENCLVRLRAQTLGHATGDEATGVAPLLSKGVR